MVVRVMARKAEPTINLAIPIGTGALAALLGVSAALVVTLTHRDVLHVARAADGTPMRGIYLLSQAIGDYTQYLRHERERAPRDHLDEARGRRALAAAAVSEMRVKEASGHLIETEAALAAMDSVVMRFRARVLSVLPRIGKECYGASSLQDAQERCENLAGEIFDELRKIRPEDLEGASLRLVKGNDGRDELG
jgi:hypothetical protein